MIRKQPKDDLVNPLGQIVNRPMCRDCADFGPICPDTGKACGDTRPPLKQRLKRIPEPITSKKEQWMATLSRAAQRTVTPMEAVVLNEIKLWLEQNA